MQNEFERLSKKKTLQLSCAQCKKVDARILFLIVFSCFINDYLLGQSSSFPEEQLALVGGTIYTNPIDSPIHDGVILIEGEEIVYVGKRGTQNIPQTAKTLDCSGMTIMAGFWNSHVHFFERKWNNVDSIPASELSQQLEEMVTKYGFTSVFDLGSSWKNTQSLRKRIELDELPGPRIFTTGEALVAAGALPPKMVFNIMGLMPFQMPEMADSIETVSVVEKMLSQGIDGLKIHLQPSSLPNAFDLSSIMPTIVEKTRKFNKPVFVHPVSSKDLVAAVEAGVDVIAHTTPQFAHWDQKMLSTLREKKVALTPTLSLWRYFLRHDRKSTQEQMVNNSVTQLRQWKNAGGLILFGTDLGAVDYNPEEEYKLMAKAGMSFREILASLTTAPTEKFQVSHQLGVIASGYSADLVVLSGDPSVNVDAFADVQYTLQNGKLIYQAIR